MHTATQFDLDAFAVELAGVPGTVEDVLPEWAEHDRFGIVITEPFGALGASLLIQLAATCFYDVKPSRRLDDHAEYPEIYAFHVGGPHGDHSAFDFWPPRKEVFVTKGTGLAVLEALNSHAITRLALPYGPVGDRRTLRGGPSTWAEEGAALGRLRSAFFYSAHGALADADVILTSRHPRAEENLNTALHPEELIAQAAGLTAEELQAALPGPSEPHDGRVFLEQLARRGSEITPRRVDRLIEQRADLLSKHGGVSTETYRTMSVDAALDRLAGLASDRAVSGG